MPRPIGRRVAPRREWETRAAVAARVRELLDHATTSELARRLGDRTRTRAHKILNPDEGQERGQSITLDLLLELSTALDTPLVEFLAPWLASKDANALAEQARQRIQADIAARTQTLMEQEAALLDRPLVRLLVNQVALAAQHMTDAELTFAQDWWDAIRHRRWSGPRRLIALDAFAGPSGTEPGED